MEPETEEQSRIRYAEAAVKLAPLGFDLVGNWRFAKNGVTYDLSAADLDQIGRIEREGLFVVRKPARSACLAPYSECTCIDCPPHRPAG